MRVHLCKIRQLSTAEWAVVVEAVFLAPIAALAVRLCRLDRAIRLVAAVPVPPALTRAALPPDGLAWVATTTTTWLGAACLTRAMVLQRLFTERGVRAVVVIGAARDARDLRAHAWVEHDGRIVSADGAHGYLPLCRVDAHGTTRVAVA